MCGLDSDDEVIVSNLHWVSYVDIVRLCGGVSIVVDSQPPDGFKLRLAALKATLLSGDRCLMVKSPGYASVAVYRRDELLALLEIIVLQPKLAILKDDNSEHATYATGQYVIPAAPMPKFKHPIQTVDGVSKFWAGKGWRVGYDAGPTKSIAALMVLQVKSTTKLSSVDQPASAAALTGPHDLPTKRSTILWSRRHYLVPLLVDFDGVRCSASDRASYLFVDVVELIRRRRRQDPAITSDVELALYFPETVSVASVPGCRFGWDSYLHICFARSAFVLVLGLANLVARAPHLPPGTRSLKMCHPNPARLFLRRLLEERSSIHAVGLIDRR